MLCYFNNMFIFDLSLHLSSMPEANVPLQLVYEGHYF